MSLFTIQFLFFLALFVSSAYSLVDSKKWSTSLPNSDRKGFDNPRPKDGSFNQERKSFSNNKNKFNFDNNKYNDNNSNKEWKSGDIFTRKPRRHQRNDPWWMRLELIYINGLISYF